MEKLLPGRLAAAEPFGGRPLAHFEIEIFSLSPRLAAGVRLHSGLQSTNYEVDGYGNFYCIDDANVPGLLSLPSLDAMTAGDKIYTHTRERILSGANPYYFAGTAADGAGSSHTATNMIWPPALIMQGLTSTNDAEIRRCRLT